MSDVEHETASVFLFARFGTSWRFCLISRSRVGGQLAAGGHVEHGEGPQQTAVREAREEARLLAPLPPAGYPYPVAPTAWHVAEIPAAADSRCPHRHLHRDHIFIGVADRLLHPVAEPNTPSTGCPPQTCWTSRSRATPW
ncbi:NUDIX domain-containing protein [Streptomyces sp. DT171]|uniref:NUDIX domain-containing protein n=1 Tax=Streptomyces sp. DT171 TaxID=3416524 RepID=UPI003CF7CC63